MHNLPALIGELENVRDLLLAPTKLAMQDCERKLVQIVDRIKETAGRYEKSLELNRLIRNIRVLLDSAKDFWDARQLATGPGQQYVSGGFLLSAPASSTFTFEV